MAKFLPTSGTVTPQQCLRIFLKQCVTKPSLRRVYFEFRPIGIGLKKHSVSNEERPFDLKNVQLKLETVWKAGCTWTLFAKAATTQVQELKDEQAEKDGWSSCSSPDSSEFWLTSAL